MSSAIPRLLTKSLDLLPTRLFAARATFEDSSGTIWFVTDKGASRYDGKSIATIPFTFLVGQPLGNSSEDTNEVWSIMQVKSGSIWFGTTNGLYFYDGSKFTRLLHDFRLINTENLKLKKIQCMLQDRSGTIWLGSGLGETEGLCRFDGKSITTVKPKVDGWIRHILQDNTMATPGSVLEILD